MHGIGVNIHKIETRHMPRKKSVRHAAISFNSAVDDIQDFVTTVSQGQSAKHRSWLYDLSIIRLYREFERLILNALVGAINNDTSTIATRTGFDFPKHLTDEVCEYLVTGTGYFDFKGRDGLIKVLKEYVPDAHYLLTSVKDQRYTAHLKQLCALRNYAAHHSPSSKKGALEATNSRRMASAGSWLKTQDRFARICGTLKQIGDEIRTNAPY